MENNKEDKRQPGKVNKSDGPILRSRQQRRSFHDRRPVKRLFTPDIKRYLKNWLIRRRENPYPNREEKAELAAQTGLTYIQVCNWFANWRRKLKNSGKRTDKFNWSYLIKGYNDQALGNVEHLSISSDDSIWEETEIERPSDRCDKTTETAAETRSKKRSSKNRSADHCYSSVEDCRSPKSHEPRMQTDHLVEYLPQCFQISSTTDFVTEPEKQTKTDRKINAGEKYRRICDKRMFRRNKKKRDKKPARDDNWNYKRMMDEFLDETTQVSCLKRHVPEGEPTTLLSKWKKSAALFRPSPTTYSHKKCERKGMRRFRKDIFHGREELDAAEALTFLSRASANR